MGIVRVLAASAAVALAMVVQDAPAQEGPKGPAKPPMMYFEGDMVLAQACVLNNRFRRNEGVVFRVRVSDAKSGKWMDDKALKSLVVELADGQKIPMKYGGHPRGGTDDYFWSIRWQIPADYPTGTLVYHIAATDSKGQIERWQPFTVKNSQLTITND
jgi:hypothetical protein